MTHVISLIIQIAALALFCAGLLLATFARLETKYFLASPWLVRAGEVLLLLAWFFGNGCSFYGFQGLLFAMCAFNAVVLYFVVPADVIPSEFMPFARLRPAVVLFEAAEVMVMMTGAFVSHANFPIGLLELQRVMHGLLDMQVIMAIITYFRPYAVYRFMSRHDGMPMGVLAAVLSLAVLAMVTTGSTYLKAPGILFNITQVVFLSITIALSATQHAYNFFGPKVRARESGIRAVIMSMAGLAFVYYGDVALGVAVELAVLLMMERAGVPRMLMLFSAAPFVVCLAGWMVVAPDEFGRVTAWLGARAVVAQDATSKLCLPWRPFWGQGICTSIDASVFPFIQWPCEYLSSTLCVFGVPGIVCLIVVATCTIWTGVRCILHENNTGVMAAFYCVVWGVQLVFDLLAALLLIPQMTIQALPFMGVGSMATVPMLAGPAIVFAINGDWCIADLLDMDDSFGPLFSVVHRGDDYWLSSGESS